MVSRAVMWNFIIVDKVLIDEACICRYSEFVCILGSGLGRGFGSWL